MSYPGVGDRAYPVEGKALAVGNRPARWWKPGNMPNPGNVLKPGTCKLSSLATRGRSASRRCGRQGRVGAVPLGQSCQCSSSSPSTLTVVAFMLGVYYYRMIQSTRGIFKWGGQA